MMNDELKKQMSFIRVQRSSFIVSLCLCGELLSISSQIKEAAANNGCPIFGD
jgi:hypothetical protein